jgi:hypothetical protein
MRSLLCLILIVFGSGALCHLKAQDCFNLQATQINCTSADGDCKQAVAVNVLINAEEGQNPGHFFFVACCDQSIRSMTNGTFCFSEARRPEVAALASKEPILVADCRGQYVAYGQGINRSNDGWSASEALKKMSSKSPLSIY